MSTALYILISLHFSRLILKKILHPASPPDGTRHYMLGVYINESFMRILDFRTKQENRNKLLSILSTLRSEGVNACLMDPDIKQCYTVEPYDDTVLKSCLVTQGYEALIDACFHIAKIARPA